MSSAANIFNNTILIPTSGSPESLPNATIGTDLQKYNKGKEKDPVKSGSFRVYFNTGGKSIPMKYCEGVVLLDINRNVETRRSGGNGDYSVKLPGPISYSPVSFYHFYCSNDVFMNWLINGTDQGGIQKANIEIKVGSETDHMVYTLQDAFPISWMLGTFSINPAGLILQTETVTYTINENQILLENLTVAYGKMEVSHETTSWGS